MTKIPEFLTISQAAKLRKVSRQAIHEAITVWETLPATFKNGHWYIHPKDFEVWHKARKKP